MATPSFVDITRFRTVVSVCFQLCRVLCCFSMRECLCVASILQCTWFSCVQGDIESVYRKIDKETPSPIDRQVGVFAIVDIIIIITLTIILVVSLGCLG